MLPFGTVQKDVTPIDLVTRGCLSGGGCAMAAAGAADAEPFPLLEIMFALGWANPRGKNPKTRTANIPLKLRQNEENAVESSLRIFLKNQHCETDKLSKTETSPLRSSPQIVSRLLRSEQTLRKCKSLPPATSGLPDVFVCSYPKSGRPTSSTSLCELRLL